MKTNEVTRLVQNMAEYITNNSNNNNNINKGKEQGRLTDNIMGIHSIAALSYLIKGYLSPSPSTSPMLNQMSKCMSKYHVNR